MNRIKIQAGGRMKIQVNSDHHIVGREGLTQHVETSVSGALAHVHGKVTRVEVHLNDENSEKSGAAEKRCMMEARVAGLKPVAVTDHADNLHQAIQHASSKLSKAVDHAIGKLSKQRPKGSAQATLDEVPVTADLDSNLAPTDLLPSSAHE
jgi:ribosome-associated translation inhibitor RaiA